VLYMKSAKWSVHHELKAHKYSLVIQDLQPIQPSPSHMPSSSPSASSSSPSTALLHGHAYQPGAAAGTNAHGGMGGARGDVSDEDDDSAAAFVNYIHPPPSSSTPAQPSSKTGVNGFHSASSRGSRDMSNATSGSSSSSSSISSLMFPLEPSLRFRLAAPSDLKGTSFPSSSERKEGQRGVYHDDNGLEAKERGFVSVSAEALKGRQTHRHGARSGAGRASPSSTSALQGNGDGASHIIQPLEHVEGFVWEQKVANVVQFEYAFVLDACAGLETALESRGSGLSHARSGGGNSSSSSTSASKPAVSSKPSSLFRIPADTRQGRGGGEGLAVTTLLYIARLCIYENFAGKFLNINEKSKGIASRLRITGERRADESSPSSKPISRAASSLDPLHTYASDEELAFLLKTGLANKEPSFIK